MRRTYSFDPGDKRHLSMPTLLRSPPKPEMPENEESNPKRYADCMRLLARSSMRSVDVVVSRSPPTTNIAICSLVNDMGPMPSHCTSPAVVAAGAATARNETKHARLRELIARGALLVPLVVPVARTMPSLICEVLHPAAHWSGSLEGGPWSDVLGAAGAGAKSHAAAAEPAARQGVGRPVVRDAGQDAGGEGGGRHRRRPCARRAPEVAARARPPRAPSPFEPGATPFFHPAHPSRLSRSEVHPPPAPDLL